MKTISPYVAPGVKTSNDAVIANAFGIQPEKMFNRTRKREIVEARQFYFWYMMMYKDKNDSELEEMYGWDRTTVIHARKTVHLLMKTDKSFRKKAEKALKRLEFLNVAV
jgi:chromosomal replication initiation ATPase DnaA